MTGDRIIVDARIVGRGLTTFLTDDIRGGRFEPPNGHFTLRGIHVTDVDFSGLVLEGFTARGSVFERCDFAKTRFKRAGLSLDPPTVYRDCRFDRTDLRGADPGVARFERCTFDHARLDGWFCTHNEFVDCQFIGPIRKVMFSARPTAGNVLGRGRNEIRGSDFRAADLRNVEFLGGIDLDAQLWPEDPSYVRLDIRPATIDRVAAVVDRLSPEERRKAMMLVSWLRGRYAGQPETMIREGEWAEYRQLLAMATVH